MAHPNYWRNEWKRTGCDFAAARRGLAELKEKGLDALEALYQANTPEEDVEFTRIASSIGLLKSAGSDFHGANKPAVKLVMEVSEQFIAPFLERLGM
jgi:predicted metal-dependent phosphoesterase TrpH